MKRSKFVKTPDNFHPPFDDGTVAVSLHQDKGKGNKQWRVAVWGADDFGMDKLGLTIDESFTLFRSIDDGITIDALRQMGFVCV